MHRQSELHGQARFYLKYNRMSIYTFYQEQFSHLRRKLQRIESCLMHNLKDDNFDSDII